ncbi:hypothetical protein GCM10020369_60120 [Cryptosporangium minutisporangium]|uniref:Uncharacterized protein n=1 Tax=Cryptosporangium minutisporangium TaxID=113569 RepID=A0ABP6T6B2_9ACTN
MTRITGRSGSDSEGRLVHSLADPGSQHILPGHAASRSQRADTTNASPRPLDVDLRRRSGIAVTDYGKPLERYGFDMAARMRASFLAHLLDAESRPDVASER